jgi:uncharacterized protein (DUF488 family)
MSENHIIFTIGHSNRRIEDFIALLEANEIELLADVRTIPRSRYNPQFNRDILPGTLGEHHIRYMHLPALGGLRHSTKSSLNDHNTAWENSSFRNYADYAETESFRLGLEKLIALAETSRTCYMCAEAVWWRCHRRIITDYLLARGWNVRHIMGPGKIEVGVLNQSAIVHADGRVTYPAAQGNLNL